MREAMAYLYVHLVWATWDRVPMLTPERRRAIYACIQAECTTMKAGVLAIGGIEDHVHLLVSYPSTVSVASLVKQVKGASSHLVTHRLEKTEGFKWQGAYAAFSLSRSELARVEDYILHQEEHHRDKTLVSEWEPES